MPTRKNQNKSDHLFFVNPVFSNFFDSSSFEGRGPYRAFTIPKGKSYPFSQTDSRGLYFVVSGIIKLEMVSPAPRLIRLATAGDMVGYGSWRATKVDDYLVTALTDSEVQFWSGQAIDKMSRENAEFNRLIIDHLMSVISHKDERIIALESHSTEERVLRLLLWLCRKFGRKIAGETLIDVHLGREALAQLAGTLPETYSRVITSLDDKRLIRRKRRQIVVMDVAALQKHMDRIAK